MKKTFILFFVLFCTLCLSFTKLNVFAEIKYTANIAPTLQNIDLEFEFGDTITIDAKGGELVAR